MNEWVEISIDEKWKYFVNSQGQIKRKARVSPNNRLYLNKILDLKPDSKGYIKIGLVTSGGIVYKYLHRIVAEIFLENPNNYQYVLHIDGNKLNNSVENLKWSKDNMNLRKNHSRLTEKDIEEIKKILPKYSDSIIGRVFKVDRKTIYDIRNGLTWT